MKATEDFNSAGRKALATFVFATTGVLAGANLFDIGADTWKLVASTGIGSLINLAYRWSEAVLKHNN